MNQNILMLLAVSLLSFSGCSSKNMNEPDPKAQLAKFKELPAWINENKNPFIAVGSAPYRGQDYIMQRDEAVVIAKSNMVHQVEAKVDALYKSYKASIGSQSTQNDNVFRRTTSQLSSRALSGTVVAKTYMAGDGELFVEVMLDPDFAKNMAILDSNQKRIMEEIRADKAFKELETEVEKIRPNQQ
jgi:hypothetical protein